MTFFYPLRNKTAFDIFDKAYKAAMQEAKQSTYGARRAAYMCSLLLARVEWAHGDLNAGPHGYQPCAPPGYAMGPY